MSVLSAAYFRDEEAAYRVVEATRWPHGPGCPRCGSLDRITKVKGGRIGLYRCGPCKRQFTVKIGTIFESSHVPLHQWLQAVFLMVSSKKGISSRQLMRILDCQYRTAWFMSHRIREAMRNGGLEPFGSLGGAAEVDETFIGNDRTMKQESQKKAARVYVREGDADLHTNTIEGYFSVFKRGMKGVQQHRAKNYLHRYLAEFDFRYDDRANLGAENAERASCVLRGVVGERLTYRDSSVADAL